jgi:hypothetical protein
MAHALLCSWASSAAAGFAGVRADAADADNEVKHPFVIPRHSLNRIFPYRCHDFISFRDNFALQSRNFGQYADFFNNAPVLGSDFGNRFQAI